MIGMRTAHFLVAIALAGGMLAGTLAPAAADHISGSSIRNRDFRCGPTGISGLYEFRIDLGANNRYTVPNNGDGHYEWKPARHKITFQSGVLRRYYLKKTSMSWSIRRDDNDNPVGSCTQ